MSDAVGLGRLHGGLVVDGEVVDDVLAVGMPLGRAVHPVEAVAHDVGDLVGERRVVVHDGRVGQREQRRVAVGVLEALAGQRGAAGGGADQEAPGQLVGHRPDRVGGALEAEHRVEDVDRDHRLAMGGVRRPGSGRRRDAARLGDALVEHLALRGLLVGHQQLAVDGLVGLAGRVVDLGRREHRVHAEGAVLVGSDRHDALADRRVLHQVLEQADERHRGGDGLLPGARPQLVVHLLAGQGELDRLHPPHGYAAPERPAPLAQVGEHVAVLARVVERRRTVAGVGVVDLLVGDRQLEPVAELLERVRVELLHLVGGVLALEGLDGPALHGVGQDHRRLARRGWRPPGTRRTPCGSRDHRGGAARSPRR